MDGIHFNVHHLPNFICIWCLTSFVTTYLTSVLGGHVYPLFPFISDTGALPPESCIFSQMMNIGWILILFALYIRFLQIKEYIDDGYIKLDQRWNKMGILSLLFICLGMSMVANFQETSIFVVHILGASFMAVFGVTYFAIQTRIGYESVKLQKKISTHGISQRMFYLRLGMISTMIICHCVLSVAGFLSYMQFTGSSVQWWTEQDGGFELRLMATFSEWILFILMLFYIASFTSEFKVIKYEGIKIKIVDVSDREQSTNGDCSTSNLIDFITTFASNTVIEMDGIHFNVHHLPNIICIWYLASFFTTYLISVLGGHVYPLFPYVSDTGALPPESCIFSLTMNVGWILMGFGMYLRFLQLNEYIDDGYIKLDQKWNKMSILCAVFICLGLSITANVQVSTAFFVHVSGGLLIAIFGISYFAIQTRIGYESVKLKKQLSTHGISERMFYLRLGMLCAMIISCCVLTVTSILSYNEFTGSSMQWWTEEDGGFELHLIATFSEWILFILMLFYITSLACEFKVINFKGINLKILDVSHFGQTSNGDCSTRKKEN